MNKLIIQTLAPLGIPVAYMNYSGKETKYIMFKVYKDEDVNYSDDENDSERYYITLSYWYHQSEDYSQIDTIKQLLKTAGFNYDGGQDLYNAENGVYGKNLDFIYTKYL